MNQTLFTETLAHNPDSSMANNNLGFELARLPGRHNGKIGFNEMQSDKYGLGVEVAPEPKGKA